MKSLPWVLGLSLFACAEGFTRREDGASGGATSTSGGDSSASGGAATGASSGATSGGSAGAVMGGKGGGDASSGGKGSGGAKSTGGGGSGAGAAGANSGGARPTGGNTNGGGLTGGTTASGGSATGGNTVAGSGGASGGSAGAGGVPEIPTDGLVLWLRADHGLTLEGNYVTRWADQSGQGNDATPSSTATRPNRANNAISSLPAVRFDGSDDFLNLPAGFNDFSQGVSIFSVRQAASIATCWSLMELSNGSEVDDIALGQYTNASLYEVYATAFTSGSVLVGTPQMISVVHRPNLSAAVRVNQDDTGNMSVQLPAVVERAQNFVGRTLYEGCTTYPGMLGELILYRRAVTMDERTTIEGYLREHWGCCTD